ncbi:MAG TPA: hypothetical protein VLX32_05375 [Candidatus Acidoferrum sp.]|nr:hypothetical protein [Candidatus Acidoferrum sp.]
MSVREELPAPTSPSASLTRWQRLGPILLLLFFAPLSGELLSGATRLSYIFVLIPEIMVWGVGALLIREAVRRTRRGWPSLISLGLALGVAEECAIQQTSFSPIVGLDPLHIYGRVFGVNWVWFFALIIFECVWIVLVPVQVVELLFPSRRNHPWLRSRGIVISSVVFLLGSCIAWYLWTQRARPIAFHVPIYTPPLAYILAGLVVILILIAIAFSFRADSGPPIIAARRAPVPIVTGIAAAILSVPAFLFIGLNFMPRRLPPFWISIAAGIVWAVLALAIIRFWAASPAWSDMHRYALVFGALIACMASSYASPGWLRLDFIGKVVINVVAVILLILLGFVLKRRSAL